MVIAIGSNFKFSALLYFAIIILPIYGYWALKQIKKIGMKNAWPIIGRVTAFFACSVVFGVIVLGIGSYVTNTIRYHNPLYTMIGEDSTEIITSQAPIAYQELSHAERFIASLLSESHNVKRNPSIMIKTPFIQKTGEFYQYDIPDIRAGGWGIYFSGIFILSIFIWFYAFIDSWKTKNKPLTEAILLVSCLLLIPINFVPGLFWARYFCYLFVFPVFSILYLSTKIHIKQYKTCVLPLVMVTLCVMNIIAPVYHVTKHYQYSSADRQQLYQLREISKENGIHARAIRGDDFYGPIVNLLDFGVENLTVDHTLQNHTYEVFQYYKVIYNIISPTISYDEYLPTYLEQFLHLEGYTVLISAKDEATQSLNDPTKAVMEQLGMRFGRDGKYRDSYLCILQDGQAVYEERSQDTLSYQTRIGSLEITMESSGYSVGNNASIKVDGQEYSLNTRGLNLVVLDTAGEYIVDVVTFDSYKGLFGSRGQ